MRHLMALMLGVCFAQFSHHAPAAEVDPLAVTERTRYSRLDVVSTTPAPSSAPYAPSQRRLNAPATDRGEKCGLDANDLMIPTIALIIDDLGNRHRQDHAAIALPGPLAYAILPFSPFATELAVAANSSGKEVLLHLPMEAEESNHLLGLGALDTDMPRDAFVAALHRALNAVPHLSGVNNHMGSRLTRDLERMRWLMAELRNTDNLLYIDSRTTPKSVARQAAAEAEIPFVARDIFLDNRRETSYIHAQIDALIAHARSRGDGVGIAHPYPETIAVLVERLEMLDDVRLVSLSTLLGQRECRRTNGISKVSH